MAQATVTKSKSFIDLDRRFAAGNALIDRIRGDQLELLRRAGDLAGRQLEQWEDLAGAEDLVRDEYKGRYLFELIQNASDAISISRLEEGDSTTNTPDKRVRLELTDRSLIVANDGRPFRPEDIDGLCRLHKQNKDKTKQIGHKGIGFKSVLEINECPEVYSDIYAFGFNRSEFTAEVNRIVKDTGRVGNIRVGILRSPFKRLPSRLPTGDRESLRRLLVEEEYSTVIRLRLKDDVAAEAVTAQMRKDLTPELLLFLEAIDILEVAYPGEPDMAFWRRRVGGGPGYEEVELHSDAGGEAHPTSRWLVINPAEMPVEDRGLLRDLGKAWEDVQAVRCQVAFPLTLDGALKTDLPSTPFHVYFQTEEFTGVRFMVNADFAIRARRTEVPPISLNKKLVDRLAATIATEGVRALQHRFPADATIVDMLAPVQRPDRAFGAYFYERYLEQLRQSSFVPAQDRTYCRPAEIRLRPSTAPGKGFHRYFPTFGLRKAGLRCTFGSPAAEDRELARRAAGRPFLTLPDMGATCITLDELSAVLRDGPIVSAKDHSGFFQFLAHWWDDLSADDKRRLLAALWNCRVIPTESGWRRPGEMRLYQANLREGSNIALPEGFDVELVPLEMYGEERSYNGTPAKFLDALGVSSYEAREIVRRTLLPRLVDREQVLELNRLHPDAIYHAYAFLRNYLNNRKGTSDGFDDDLPKIHVPAWHSSHEQDVSWLQASEVYFSRSWSGNDDLEALYGRFEDGWFLANMPDLSLSEDTGARREWYDFFARLGVCASPRIILCKAQYYTLQVRQLHPFHGLPLWPAYLDSIQSLFHCQANGSYTAHQLGDTWAIDHFEDLAATGDASLLVRLFRLIGRHWESYSRCLKTEVSCARSKNRCLSRSDSSYLRYCLEQTDWIPAEQWGQVRAYRAGDIWNLGDDVRPEVRRMVPSLPEQFCRPEYLPIRTALLKMDIGFGDYVQLLRRLPELCPLDRADLDADDRKKWQEATRAVFNWLLGAIYNGLVRLGSKNWAKCPPDLPILASLDGSLRYLRADAPNLAIDDDAGLSAEWSAEIATLKIDDDWGSLRDWLEISRISERVVSELQATDDLPRETHDVEQRFSDMLPYFLARVYDRQNSRFRAALSRLRHLAIHVVEALVVEQTVPGVSSAPRRLSRLVHLASHDEPNPKGVGKLRTGDLYLVRTEIDNPDVLGGYIAGYIEIEGLADAFVMLYERSNVEDRLRYLRSKGIHEDVVAEVLRELAAEVDDTLPPDYQALLEKLRDRKPIPAPHDDITNQAEPETDMDNPDTQGDRPPQRTPPPELDLHAVTAPELYEAGDLPASTPSVPHHGARRSRQPDWHSLSESERELYGRRGEQWAYEAEKQRLTELGFKPDELEQAGKLKWVSKTDKYSPYDIRSIDGIDGSEAAIYIEVKSTTGDEQVAIWTIREFDLARDKGSAYWLYWVSRVDKARPKPPLRVQDPIRLWQEKRLQVDFRQLEIRLPEDLRGAVTGSST